MADRNPTYPRAEAYLTALPKDAILRWLTQSTIGRAGLAELEAKLARPGPDADKLPAPKLRAALDAVADQDGEDRSPVR